MTRLKLFLLSELSDQSSFDLIMLENLFIYIFDSRYPCYYAPADPTYVVARYNLQHTRWLFLIFFIVPASLLILSCGVLFTCSRILNVDNSGHMNLDCCNPGTHSELSSSHLQFKSFEKDADHL